MYEEYIFLFVMIFIYIIFIVIGIFFTRWVFKINKIVKYLEESNKNLEEQNKILKELLEKIKN